MRAVYELQVQVQHTWTHSPALIHVRRARDMCTWDMHVRRARAAILHVTHVWYHSFYVYDQVRQTWCHVFDATPHVAHTWFHCICTWDMSRVFFLSFENRRLSSLTKQIIIIINVRKWCSKRSWSSSLNYQINNSLVFSPRLLVAFAFDFCRKLMRKSWFIFKK